MANNNDDVVAEPDLSTKTSSKDILRSTTSDTIANK